MDMRDYQGEAVDSTLSELQRYASALIVMATGLGKTVVAAHVAKPFIGSGRVLMLAHRAELIYQGAKTMERVTGEKPDIEMGDNWSTQGWCESRILMSTIQTQIAGREGGRMTRFDPDDFSLVIVDEAHHGTARSYRKVLDHYTTNADLKVLGLTATPDRADEEALGQIFDVCAYEYDIRQGVDGGWLVPVSAQSVYVEGLNFANVRTTAGDLNGADLAKIMEYEENLHEIAKPTLELTGDKKTLIFAVTVAQATRLAEILNRYKGGSAEIVSGTTPKPVRQDLFEAYKAGRFQYLVNVGIATEGFDEPSIEAVVMARPTKSRSLFAQMAGRGTRPLPGIVDGCMGGSLGRKEAIAASAKPRMEIIDFVGNAGRHKLIHMADILGGNLSDEICELAQEMSEKSNEPRDIITDLQAAEREIAHRKQLAEEAKIRNAIRAKVKYTSGRIDPFSVLDMEAPREKGYNQRGPTDRQVEALQKFGVETVDLSFRGASKLMDALIKRIKSDKSSFKQSKCLRRFGVDTQELGFKMAGQLITELAQHGWKRTPRFEQMLGEAN